MDSSALYRLLEELDTMAVGYQKALAHDPLDAGARANRLLTLWFRDRLEAALDHDRIANELVLELENHPLLPRWKHGLPPPWEPPESV